jgi:hypothetical protein
MPGEPLRRCMQLLSTALGPGSPQVWGGAGAAADRMVDWVRLALLGMPAPEKQLGAPVWQMDNHGLRRASRCGVRGMRLLGPASLQARGGAGAAADRMVGGLRHTLFKDAARRPRATAFEPCRLTMSTSGLAQVK